MLRPGARVWALGVGVGVGVPGAHAVTPSTAEWTAACAQQAHTRCRLGSVAAELCVGVSEAWGAATGLDVADCWAVSVAEAFTRRWLALPEELSNPCSNKAVADHPASLEAAVPSVAPAEQCMQ